MKEHPKVFISYSHDSEEHKKWVLKLATELRNHGIDIIFDQWDLKYGSDIRLFMEQGLNNSSMILCICSEKYTEKFNQGEGGSGYEGMIMTQSLLQNCDQDYIIPLQRNNFSNKMPLALTSKLYLDFSKDDEYQLKYNELLKRIYGVDEQEKPPLGKNPLEKNMKKVNKFKTEEDIEEKTESSPLFKLNLENKKIEQDITEISFNEIIRQDIAEISLKNVGEFADKIRINKINGKDHLQKEIWDKNEYNIYEYIREYANKNEEISFKIIIKYKEICSFSLSFQLQFDDRMNNTYIQEFEVRFYELNKRINYSLNQYSGQPKLIKKIENLN